MRGSLKVTSYNSNCNKFIRSDPEGDKKGFSLCLSSELPFVKQTNIPFFGTKGLKKSRVHACHAKDQKKNLPESSNLSVKTFRWSSFYANKVFLSLTNKA